MPDIDLSQYVTLRDGAAILGCTVKALRERIRYHRVPVAKVGWTTLIRRADLAKLDHRTLA